MERGRCTPLDTKISWHTPITAFLLFVTSSSLALLFASRMVRREIPVTPSGPLGWSGAMIWASLPLAGYSLLMVLNTQLDIIMLGMFSSDSSVGVYNIAFRCANLALFMFYAVNQVMQPLVVRLHEEGDLSRMQAVVTLGARISFAMAIGTALVLAIFGNSLLTLFGEEFLGGLGAIQILCGGFIVQTVIGSPAGILTMTGLERTVVLSMLCTVAVNAALNFVLIPRLGIEGAALATAASWTMNGLLLATHVRRRLRIDSTVVGASLQRIE